MSKLIVSHLYPVEPAQLWGLVGDPAALANWHPAIASSACSEVGKRVCTLADGATIEEEITAHDENAKRYTYRIVQGPLPMKGYVSTLSVTAESGGARLAWECEFEAVGAPAAEVENMVRGLYQAGIDNVRALLTS